MFGTRSGTIGLVDLSPTNGTICYEIDTKTCAGKTFYFVFKCEVGKKSKTSLFNFLK